MARGETYEEFTAKFRKDGHRMTTDDCYTPDHIYRCVLDWTVHRYHLNADTRIIRPFYPGGDYKREDYSGDCIVVDNPPFSILLDIQTWYMAKGIRFLMFCQGLTIFNTLAAIRTGEEICEGVCQILPEYRVRYTNGAEINTAFVTNMEGANRIVIQGDLHDALKKAGGSNEKTNKQRPAYPANLVTSAQLGKYATRGLCIDIPDQVFFQSNRGLICGGGMVLSDRARTALDDALAQSEQEMFRPVLNEYTRLLAEQNSITAGDPPKKRTMARLDDWGLKGGRSPYIHRLYLMFL